MNNEIWFYFLSDRGSIIDIQVKLTENKWLKFNDYPPLRSNLVLKIQNLFLHSYINKIIY